MLALVVGVVCCVLLLGFGLWYFVGSSGDGNKGTGEDGNGGTGEDGNGDTGEPTRWPKNKMIVTYQSFSAHRHPTVLAALANMCIREGYAGMMGWPSLDDPNYPTPNSCDPNPCPSLDDPNNPTPNSCDPNTTCQYHSEQDNSNTTTIYGLTSKGKTMSILGGWLNMGLAHMKQSWTGEGVTTLSAGHMTPHWPNSSHLDLGQRSNIEYFFYTLGGEYVGSSRQMQGTDEHGNFSSLKDMRKVVNAHVIDACARSVTYTDPVSQNKVTPNGICFDMEGILRLTDSNEDKRRAVLDYLEDVILDLKQKNYKYFAWVPMQSDIEPIPDPSQSGFTHVAPMLYSGNGSYDRINNADAWAEGKKSAVLDKL